MSTRTRSNLSNREETSIPQSRNYASVVHNVVPRRDGKANSTERPQNGPKNPQSTAAFAFSGKQSLDWQQYFSGT